MEQSIRLILGGDVMLGRDVADRIAASGASYPLAPLAERLQGAHVTVVSFDGAIVIQSWPLRVIDPASRTSPPVIATL